MGQVEALCVGESMALFVPGEDGPAESVRTRIFGPSDRARSGRYSGGSDANACSSTTTWSAAVFDPALPGRSNPANASPPAMSGRSKNANNGW